MRGNPRQPFHSSALRNPQARRHGADTHGRQQPGKTTGVAPEIKLGRSESGQEFHHRPGQERRAAEQKKKRPDGGMAHRIAVPSNDFSHDTDFRRRAFRLFGQAQRPERQKKPQIQNGVDEKNKICVSRFQDNTGDRRSNESGAVPRNSPEGDGGGEVFPRHQNGIQ